MTVLRTLPIAIPGYAAEGELLGEGGMGCVYRVHEPSLHRDVAIKFMRKDLAGEPESRERFLREARTQAAVKHHHVADIYRVGEIDGVPFLVMPLIQGRSLEAHLRACRRPPLAFVVRIAGEIAQGMAAAHDRGLVHRDLKPSNVMLEGPDERVRVVDFGLARATDGSLDVSSPGKVSGTPGYMSPEQVHGQPVGPASDVFALATVLYEMLTGTRPFHRPGVSATLFAIATDAVPPVRAVNPDVPAELAELLAEMHEKGAGGRPTMAAVVRRLRAIPVGPDGETVETLSMQTVPTGPVVVPRRSSRRWPWLVGLAAVVLVGLGLWWGLGRAVPSKPAPPVADLEVRVWKAGQFDDVGKLLWEPGVLPLRSGDAIRLEATVDRPAYLYLVHLRADGKILPGYPWDDEDWNKRPSREEPRKELNIPKQADVGFVVDGPAVGVEAFVLFVRDEPMPADTDFPAMLADWRAQSTATAPAISQHLVDGRPDGANGTRDRYKNLAAVNNPMGVLRDLTRSLREGQQLGSRAVSFGYQGK